MTSGALKLTPVVQHYAWGAGAPEALVYRFAVQNGIADPENSEWPYAELWFGAHPKGSSKTGAGDSLHSLVESDPQKMLGQAQPIFGNSLPFLFKVLSIRIPLSIQLHPNKAQAESLHRQNARDYPDSNHKPEIAYTLTELSLLYGFRRYYDIRESIESVPELQELITQPTVEQAERLANTAQEESAVRLLFETLLRAEPTRAKAGAIQLTERLRSDSWTTNRGLGITQREEWILSAADAHPNDPGIFAFYFLNLLTLPPGRAVYTDAGIPHAYLHGEILECMASSDNTIRAGLTPKVCDIEALLECANFSSHDPVFIEPRRIVEGIDCFTPPAPEFQFIRYDSTLAGVLHATDNTTGPEIWFVLSGSAELCADGSTLHLHEGEAAFLPAKAVLTSAIARNGVTFRILPNLQ